MARLSEGQAELVRGPNYAVVAVARPDGSIHQSVVWVDWDGEHVLLNLNTWRAKLRHLEEAGRLSVLVIDRENPYRWLGIEGRVVETTTDGAYEHIVKQAGVYRGRDTYDLQPGEQRVLVRVALERLQPYRVD